MAKQRASRPLASVHVPAGVRLFSGITGLLVPALLIRHLDPRSVGSVRRSGPPCGRSTVPP